jgi:hypothetical protein
MADLLESNLGEALTHAGLPGTSMKVVETIHDSSPETVFQTVFDFMERNATVPAVLLVAEDGVVLQDYLRSEDSYPELRDGPKRPEDITESAVAFVLGCKERVDAMWNSVPRETGGKDAMKPFWEKDHSRRSAGVFAPSTWVPYEWSRTLLDRFSKLTVLGHLHRPHYISFQGEGGFMGQGAKTTAFSEGWQAMLDTRENEEKLTHLFFEYGSVEHGRRLSPLCRTLQSFEPDWDAFDQGIGIHSRLGDTGSNAPFLALALGVIASFREGGMSVCAHLRREDRASLLMITEPTERTEADDGVDPLEAAYEDTNA